MHGIDWKKVKKHSKMNKDGYIVIENNEILTLNKAIHELITLKKRHINANEPRKKAEDVQIEIDKLMKRKRIILEAEKFMDWKRRNKID